MKSKMRITGNRTVIGIICIVLALGITFGIAPLVNRFTDRKVEVVQVKQNVERGHLITEDDVELVKVGALNLSDRTVKNKKYVVGKYAATNLYAGQIMIADLVAEKSNSADDVLSALDGTKVAISVNIASFAQGLSNKLQNGDIVSVIVYDKETNQSHVPPELRYVKVITTTTGDSVDSDRKTDATQAITVTLLASPDQAKQLWGDRFQVVVSTHTNTGKIHNHFCLNSVSFTDGKRYYDQKATYYKMREVSDDLCEDYGLSVIEHPGRGSKQYKAWLGDKDGTSQRDAVRADINAVLEYATSFRQFQIEIQNRGYILEYRGSFLRIRPDEGKKFFRLDRLGDGYSDDEIRERCRCNYENRPRPGRVAFVYQKRERATGIVGLYRHYVYLLKHFPHEIRPFDRTAYAAMRDDARKMKRYSEEAKLLAANDIVTAEDLQHFTENIGTRFKALAYERAKQRNRLRRMHDSTAMQPTKEIIYDLSAQMAELRRQMKLCEDIAERCGVVEMVVNEIERGQEREESKNNQEKKKEKTER